MSDEALRSLAMRAGLLIDWNDYRGQPQSTSLETLRAVLAAMGLPADDDAAIHASDATLAGSTDAPDFVTGEAGEYIRIDTDGPARLILEDGRSEDVDPRRVLIDLPGYHHLLVGERALTLAIAPARAPSVLALTGRAKAWGSAVQLYGLRGHGGGEFGDFAALAEFAAALGRAGADALAISPAHALFAAAPDRYSPYSPSSRDFLNVLYADASAAPDPSGDPLIHWHDASPRRLARLRAACAGFTGDAAFDAFVTRGGEPLRLHALFEAIDGHVVDQGGASGWQNWPEPLRDVRSEAVATFAREHAEAVRFHLFLQWRADQGLARAQAAARDAGMAIGLVTDLAVGIDTGGSHAWSRREELIAGLTIGAPPDGFQAEGQGWGITGFSPIALRDSGYEPYLRTLRAALRHAGGVRIDHALGLGRLWVIPDGARPLDGCYMRYPEADMLRLLALEAHRARAIIVGEDLGTVPDGFRDRLAAQHLLGMSILPFERGLDGSFDDPAGWRRASAAMTSTHDLVPMAGWWRGSDIPLRKELGLIADTPEQRAADRAALWARATASGVASGDPPPAEEPAAAVDAAVALVGRSASELAIVPAEDLFALVDSPNVPGTTEGHPNWRRRYPADADTLFTDPAVRRRTAILRDQRP